MFLGAVHTRALIALPYASKIVFRIQTHLIRLLSPTYDRSEVVELIEAACTTQAVQKHMPRSCLFASDPDQVALLPSKHPRDWTTWALSTRPDSLRPSVSRYTAAAIKGVKRIAAAVEGRAREGSASDEEGAQIEGEDDADADAGAGAGAGAASGWGAGGSGVDADREGEEEPEELEEVNR